MYEIRCLDAKGNEVRNLTQWDLNMSLYIESDELNTAPIFHFSNKNSKRALCVNSIIKDGFIIVDIPNVLLREPFEITAYIYLTENYNTKNELTSRTIKVIHLPLIKRVQPSDYEYSDNVNVVYLSELITEVTQLSDYVNAKESERQNNENNRIANETTRQNASAIAIQNCEEATNKAINDCELTANNIVAKCENSTNACEQATAYVETVIQSYQTIEDAKRIVLDSERTVLDAKDNVADMESNVEGMKNTVEDMINRTIIQSTLQVLTEIENYLEEINSAKDSFALHVAAGNASSFDVQNIDGGTAMTVDPYKYDTGNALSVIN